LLKDYVGKIVRGNWIIGRDIQGLLIDGFSLVPVLSGIDLSSENVEAHLARVIFGGLQVESERLIRLAGFGLDFS